MKRIVLFVVAFFFFHGNVPLSAQVLFSENFESTTSAALPTGWQQNVTPNDTVGFHCGTYPTLGSTHFIPGHHSRFVALNDDSGQYAINNSVLLQTPAFSLAGISSSNVAMLYFEASFLPMSRGIDTEKAFVEISTDGGSTWTVLAPIACNSFTYWEPRRIVLSGYSGATNVKIGFRYFDARQWMGGLALDSVAVHVVPLQELALTTLEPQVRSAFSYGLVGSNKYLSGTVTNNGGVVVNSFTFNYRMNSGAVHTDTINTVVPPFSSMAFVDSTPVVLPFTPGDYPLRAWIKLTGDAVPGNDSSGYDTLTAVRRLPAKKLVVEEGTGTGCGWCVRGLVFLDSLETVYGNGVNLIAVHYNDTMALPPYISFMTSYYFTNGYPSIACDRTYVADPQYIFDYYDKMHDAFGYADIVAQGSYTGSVLNVSVNVRPAIDLRGRYRLQMVVTEDGVHGLGHAWDQLNYYSGRSTPILSGRGLVYNNLPYYVPDTVMQYNHVARSVTPAIGDITSTLLPALMRADSTYPFSFTDTIDATWNRSQLHAVIMLIDNATGRVCNSAGVVFSLQNEGVATVEAPSLQVMPNPAGNTAALHWSNATASPVSFMVYNAAGRLVFTTQTVLYGSGAHSITIPVAQLEAGNYFVRMVSGTSSAVQRLQVVH